MLKWTAQKRPTIGNQLSTQLRNQQKERRMGPLKQIRAIQYLTRQGIPLQGHIKSDGNLYQLMLTLSHEDTLFKSWITNDRYTCHQSVNELIDIMGQNILHTLLSKIKTQLPPWYSVIADEATDICITEQLNLSIRWVDNNFEVHEDPVGLFRVPDTTTGTLFEVVKDILTRCNLPLNMCRGKAYDGAANMQGKRTGVATRFLAMNPAAIPVHCFAHSLNLCLQDTGRNIVYLRDALELVREISKLIKFSPKRLHLFSSRLQEAGEDTVTLKSICLTRWTAGTAAIDAVLKDYHSLLEVLDEIYMYHTTKDDYGLKAYGLLQLLEKSAFGLMLSYQLSSASEQVSPTLQKKNISIHDALSALEAAKAHFKRIRKEEFDRFYAKALAFAEEHKRPSRYDDESEPHYFSNEKQYYRKMYYEVCDLILGELEDRFNTLHLQPVLCMEQILLKAANKQEFEPEVRKIE